MSSSADLLKKPEDWNLDLEFKLDRQLGDLERWRRHLYSFSMFLHEGIWIGLAQVMNYPRCISSNGGRECAIHIYLATSRDGVHFDLGWIYANTTIGIENSHPDAMRFSSSNQWVTRDGKHELLYSTSQVPHPPGHYGPNYWMKHEVPEEVTSKEEVFHVAQWEQDRVVGLASVDEKQPGVVTTKKIKLAGNKVVLNLDTSAKGATIQLEMDIYNGESVSHTISGEPIANSNNPAHIIKWDKTEEMSSLKGSVVQFRLTLTGAAQLFALAIEA